MLRKLALFLALILMMTLTAAAEELPEDGELDMIAGYWMHTDGGEQWLSLYIAEDGTGHLNNMPEDIGVAISVKESTDAAYDYMLALGADDETVGLVADTEAEQLILVDDDGTETLFDIDLDMGASRHWFAGGYSVRYDEDMICTVNEDGSVDLVSKDLKICPAKVHLYVVESDDLDALLAEQAARLGASEEDVSKGLFDFSEDQAGIVTGKKVADGREIYADAMVVIGNQSALIAQTEVWGEDEENTIASDTVASLLGSIRADGAED